MRKVIFFFVFQLVLISFIAAQDLKTFDYSKADSIALNMSRRVISTEKLAAKLTEDLTTEHEQFRAIFRWVTDNIAYDITQRNTEPQKVLQYRKAVCSGYADLLKELCDFAKIECVTISGYSKVIEKRDIGEMDDTDHAWNAVKLNGEWYLVDATWAAGHVNNRTFTKKYNDFYFLTPPEHFIYNHYPADQKWLLMTTDLTLKQFGKRPIYYGSYFEKGITFLNDPKGEVGDKLKLQFTSTEPIRHLAYLFSNQRKYETLDFEAKDGVYSVSIDFNKYQRGELLIYMNQHPVIGFIKK